MVAFPGWVGLEQLVDNAVDGRFGELVELHPWTNIGFGGGGGPDPNRTALVGPHVVGIFVTQGAHALGEGSSGAAGASIPLLEAKIWLSIQYTVLGDPANWQTMDRVFFPQREPGLQWYNVNHIDPVATYRYTVHLDRMQAVDMQATMRYASRLRRPGALVGRRA